MVKQKVKTERFRICPGSHSDKLQNWDLTLSSTGRRTTMKLLKRDSCLLGIEALCNEPANYCPCEVKHSVVSITVFYVLEFSVRGTRVGTVKPSLYKALSQFLRFLTRKK